MHKCSGWPPQKVVAKSLDRLQSKMIACMMRVPIYEHEGPAEYVRRRNHIASRLAGKSGRWSSHWFRKAVSWHRHLQRGHDHESWAVQLANHRGELWLEARRALSSTNRPGSRRMAGPPRKRWHEGIQMALGAM
eukprot:12753949-Alexandrium_andersonii.AAC.1